MQRLKGGRNFRPDRVDWNEIQKLKCQFYMNQKLSLEAKNHLQPKIIYEQHK
jgi:hypothetical protein